MLDVVQISLRHPVVDEELHRLPERELECAFWALTPLELVRGELLADELNLLMVTLAQATEDVKEEAVEKLEYLVVMLLDGHLEVEPDELCQVSVRIRVLRAKDGPNLVHALKVGRDRHLLRELG